MGFPSQVRRVKQGIITRFAGDFGQLGCTCFNDGTLATHVSMESIQIAAFNSSGSVFGGTNVMVFVVAPNNTMYHFVDADLVIGSGGDGGPALTASLGGPNGLATDAAGNLYIADAPNDRIRKVTLH